jgi:hypothetical protein
MIYSAKKIYSADNSAIPLIQHFCLENRLATKSDHHKLPCCVPHWNFREYPALSSSPNKHDFHQFVTREAYDHCFCAVGHHEIVVAYLAGKI